MIHTSAILFVTDAASLERLESTKTWPQVALRYEEMKDVDTVIFACRDCQAVTHTAILKADEPWVPVHVKGQPVTFRPAIAEVFDMFDPIEVPQQSMQLMESMDKMPVPHREAMMIEDLDNLLNSEDPSGFLISCMIDQHILNRRNFDTTAALNALEGSLGDMESLEGEFAVAAARPAIVRDAYTELPEGWESVCEPDQVQSLMATLNSAFS